MALEYRVVLRDLAIRVDLEDLASRVGHRMELVLEVRTVRLEHLRIDKETKNKYDR